MFGPVFLLTSLTAILNCFANATFSSVLQVTKLTFTHFTLYLYLYLSESDLVLKNILTVECVYCESVLSHNKARSPKSIKVEGIES